MAKGIAINIGLDFVDKQHYCGWDGKLKGCVHDADDMYAIAAAQGFCAKKIINGQATRQGVIQLITQASAVLQSGDILFISYAGHGSTLPDYSGDEDDGQDETWCLYDGQLVDDDLFALWHQIAAGVRVLVISDSCHSGTITKYALQESQKYTDRTPRAMPLEVLERVWANKRAAYRSLAIEPGHKPFFHSGCGEADIAATVRLLAACQDNQLAYDGDYNGYFTMQLKRVWGNGCFGGNYAQFHKQILAQMPAYQSPNHFVIGTPNPVYDRQRPFQIL